MKPSNFKFVFFSIYFFIFSLSTQGFELKCKKKTDQALKVLEIKKSSVDVITNNECEEENFIVDFRVIKEINVKGIKVSVGTVINVNRNSLSDLHRDDKNPIEISKNISCSVRASFGYKPNIFCGCIIAKPYVFDGVTLPIGTEMQFTEQMEPEWFRVGEDKIVIASKSRRIDKRYAVIKGKVEEIPIMEMDRCNWD